MIVSLVHRLWLRWLKLRGLQIAPDCRVIGFPNFGSEPYLISIGQRVVISFGVSFITHDGGTTVFRHRERYQQVIKYGRIVIRENCFIGARTVILPGVTIGPNSVAAAGSVVTKDVLPNTVVAGVPARVLCTVDEYAEASLRNTPEYQADKYLQDKRVELLRLYPRPW